MPAEDSKLYNEIKGKLERLSGGVNKHSTDADFPGNITAAVIEAKTVLLVNARKLYDDAEAVAHQKYQEYENISAECEEMFSKISTQLYGLYGKQNLLVEDYGLKIYQKPPGRKAKTDTPAQ
ncbi:MAG: hypothetical protein NTX22_00065 [Ignavibacteriales bacterium]|nr:hypothetical protein [Ignavibacteriales bacterium]